MEGHFYGVEITHEFKKSRKGKLQVLLASQITQKRINNSS